MPDFVLMAESFLLSAIVASFVLATIALPTKARSWQLAALPGLAGGIYAGCILIGEWPRWPPTEDRHRFLVILLPLALAVEAAALLFPGRRVIVWGLRIALSAA